MIKFLLLAYLINFTATQTVDNKVQFEYKEFDYKETSKNVSCGRKNQNRYFSFQSIAKITKSSLFLSFRSIHFIPHVFFEFS